MYTKCVVLTPVLVALCLTPPASTSLSPCSTCHMPRFSKWNPKIPSLLSHRYNNKIYQNLCAIRPTRMSYVRLPYNLSPPPPLSHPSRWPSLPLPASSHKPKQKANGKSNNKRNTRAKQSHTHTLTSATKTVGEAVGVGCWAPFRCAGVWLRLCLANISFVSCVLFILLRSHRTRNGENWADFEERTIKLKYIQAQRIKDRYITYSPNKLELLRYNSIKTMWKHLGSSIQSKLPKSSFSRIWSNFPLVHSSLI